MTYTYDHDLHIHTHLSPCSGDPEQTAARILRYAKERGLHTVCLTDHYWDEALPMNSSFYRPQTLSHLKKILPLPEESGITFLFGCETELDAMGRIGIAPERYDAFDFIIVPTSHMHMGEIVIRADLYRTAEQRAAAWISRIDTLLNSDLPFHKVGLAHPVTHLLVRGDDDAYLALLDAIPESEMRRVMSRAAALGVGIELNADCPALDPERVLRPYRVARECGCKFYVGGDAHTPKALDGVGAHIGRLIAALDLEECDKMAMPKKSASN